MAQTGLKRADRPLMPLWALVPLFLAIPVGQVLGAAAAAADAPMPVRIGAALAAWLGPLLGVFLMRFWLRRLDEFQRTLVMQAVGWAGVWTVFFLVGTTFYHTLTGASQPHAYIGGAPGTMAFAAGLMLAALERRARRATQDARE